MATVNCRECGAPIINEASDVPFDQRGECPECGSRSRSFVVGLEDQGLAHDDGLASVQGQPGDPVTVAAPVAGGAAGATAGAPVPRPGLSPADSVIVADHTFILTCTQTPGGVWLALVYDQDGALVELSPQDEVTDALLSVIEDLIPPAS
jgi:hypothetical protein